MHPPVYNNKGYFFKLSREFLLSVVPMVNSLRNHQMGLNGNNLFDYEHERKSKGVGLGVALDFLFETMISFDSMTDPGFVQGLEV